MSHPFLLGRRRAERADSVWPTITAGRALLLDGRAVVPRKHDRGCTFGVAPTAGTLHQPRQASRYNSLMATMSYLERLLDPLTEAFTPQVASALLELHADSELEVHIRELRRKANEGTLTSVEDVEYKDFVEAVDLISIMQAKARRFLARQSA